MSNTSYLEEVWFFFPLKLLRTFSSPKSPFQDFMMISNSLQKDIILSYQSQLKTYVGEVCPTVFRSHLGFCWVDVLQLDRQSQWRPCQSMMKRWRVVGETLPELDMPDLVFAAPVSSLASPDLLCTLMSKSYSSSVLQCLALHLFRGIFNDLKGIFQPKSFHDSIFNPCFP